MRAIGLSQDGETAFVLQLATAWGEFRSPPPGRIPGPLGELMTAVPVGEKVHDDWRLGAPFADFWSARYTTKLKVPRDGRYTLYVSSDDGARAWVDDKKVIDDWRPRSGDTSEAEVSLTAGEHLLRCEYFERSGGAQIHIEWKGPGFERQVIPAEATSMDGKPGWKAEYFGNQDLKGEAKLDHHEVIDFNWGADGPKVFGGGDPSVTFDWIRISDTAILARATAPRGTYIGLLVEPVGTAQCRIEAQGAELAALARDAVGNWKPLLRVRALNPNATTDTADPAALPGVWAPAAAGPAVFLAGLGDLPDVDLQAALSKLEAE